LKNFIRLMRPKHYIKNGLIFLPLLFSRNLLQPYLLKQTFFGFIIFSLASSIVYIFNDILDVEKDKKHPTKKIRPIASGAVSKTKATTFILVLLILLISLHYIFFATFLPHPLIFTYLILNLFYSIYLKNVPILDITALSLGFLLRVFYGANLINVIVSDWLYLTVIAMSFYLGLGKRRNEVIQNEKNARTVLTKYNRNFLDKNMYVCVGLTIVFYSMWCIDTVKLIPYIMWTVPLVMIICMKYSLTVEGISDGDPVSTLLHDSSLFLLVLLYGAVIFTLIYLIP